MAFRWWTDLPATVNKTKWAEIRAEFAKHWVPLPDLDDNVDRKKEELETLTLTPASLGTKVKYCRQEIYAHVAFTEEAFRLGTDIGDDKGFLIVVVRKRLPEVVKELTRREKIKTWKQFHESISTISISMLTDKIE